MGSPPSVQSEGVQIEAKRREIRVGKSTSPPPFFSRLLQMKRRVPGLPESNSE